MSALREQIEEAVYGATPASRKQAAQAAKWILALPAIAAALERQGEGENERHMRNLGSIADALYGDASAQGER